MLSNAARQLLIRWHENRAVPLSVVLSELKKSEPKAFLTKNDMERRVFFHKPSTPDIPYRKYISSAKVSQIQPEASVENTQATP